ncbi:MAG: nuclear transport factor 2 family protein [Actinomycetota bacterium]|nr:nuclear transport factor 2 family protein [Actinomycetota bacterium]
MLPRIARLVAPVLALGLLAGCSGGDSPPPPDPSVQARDAVTATFTAYSQALLRRDFTTACLTLTDDAKKALVADLNQRTIPAQTCDQSYAALYATEAAGALDEQGRTIRVTDVKVDGATASLTYTGTVKGRQLTQTVRAVQVAGGWQIAPGA